MKSSLLEKEKTIFRKRTFCVEWIGNMKRRENLSLQGSFLIIFETMWLKSNTIQIAGYKILISKIADILDCA